MLLLSKYSLRRLDIIGLDLDLLKKANGMDRNVLNLAQALPSLHVISTCKFYRAGVNCREFTEHNTIFHHTNKLGKKRESR